MGQDAVEKWVQGYVRAWESNDPEDIARLFTEDAWYLTAPSRSPWSGRDQIVQGWLERKEKPGTWRFRFETIGSSGTLFFVRGWTEYPQEGEAYDNLWVLRLEGDRCSEFTEWWMKRPIETD